MKHLLRISGFACCLFLASLTSLFAQNAAPDMTVVLSSTDRLKDDIKCMLDLTTPAEQKQWKTVEEYLDEVFLMGLDGKRLHRYDLISGPKGVNYRSSFPIANEGDFRQNLTLFGIDVKRRTRTYYQLSKAYDGILRIIENYGVIGQKEDVPARGFMPIDATMKKYALLPDGKTAIHDLMFLLLNQNGKPADRQKAYADVKKELMAAVKQAEDETAEDFELRRSLTELQIDELGRYYTDSKELLIGWTLDDKLTKKGSALIDLLPDVNTPLAQAVAKLAAVPSRYEAIAEPEGKILSGRLNLPLDDLQIGNLAEVVELLANRGKAAADTSETMDDKQKEAMQQAITLLAASATDTVKSGRLDGFVNCRPSQNGKFTILGGFQFKDAGTNVNAAIKQLQIARPERKIAIDVEQQDGFTIHEIPVSPDHQLRCTDLCGSDKFHIGVGEHEIWYAIGTDSTDAIKSALAEVDAGAKVQANPEFFSFYLKAGPWIEWLDRHAKPPAPEIQKVSGEEEAKEGEEREKKIKVDRDQLRKQAIDAFQPGDDVWTLSLKKDEDRVKGSMGVDTGILRLVGKMVAQFSKDTLEE